MKRILLAATVLLAAFAWSCKKEEKVTDAVTIKTDETIVSVEGGVVSIALNATVAWTAKSSQNWVTISPASGNAGDATIKASVLKNDTNDNRNAEITITAGTAKATYNLVQSQKDAVVVPTTEFAVGAEGDVVEIPFSANVDVNVLIPEAVDWIKQTEPNGVKGMVDKKVYLLVDASTDLEPRTANITLTDGTISQVVKISQAAFEAYCDFQNELLDNQYGGRLTVPQQGGKFVLEVSSNLDWRAHYDEEWPPEDTSWLVLEQTEDAIVITVQPNEGYIARDNWIYVNAGEALYGDVFGGYFQVYQEGLEAPVAPQKEWAVAFPEAIFAGYNRLAYTKENALLISDGEKIHVLNPEDGTYVKEIATPGIKPVSICNDDAGNIIIADNVTADMNWDTGELTSGTTLNVYCVQSESDTPKVISLPNGVYGTLGGFRARGDLATKGSITGVAGGASYWFGYDIAEFAPVANYYGTQNSGNHAGPDTFWSPETGAAISYGADLHDGVLMRAYDGDAGGQRVHFRKDAYTPEWYATSYGLEYEKWTEITTAGAGGNENQNNMDVLDYNGKKILAFTQGYHFTWAGFNADIYVLDITDTANPQVLATVKTADWITAEWPNGANSADILLREGEGVIEMYVDHSGLATIAKFIFNP